MDRKGGGSDASRKMCKDRYVLICISFSLLLGVELGRAGENGRKECRRGAWMAGKGVEIALRKIVIGDNRSKEDVKVACEHRVQDGSGRDSGWIYWRLMSHGVDRLGKCWHRG